MLKRVLLAFCICLLFVTFSQQFAIRSDATHGNQLKTRLINKRQAEEGQETEVTAAVETETEKPEQNSEEATDEIADGEELNTEYATEAETTTEDAAEAETTTEDAAEAETTTEDAAEAEPTSENATEAKTTTENADEEETTVEASEVATQTTDEASEVTAAADDSKTAEEAKEIEAEVEQTTATFEEQTSWSGEDEETTTAEVTTHETTPTKSNEVTTSANVSQESENDEETTTVVDETVKRDEDDLPTDGVEEAAAAARGKSDMENPDFDKSGENKALTEAEDSSGAVTASTSNVDDVDGENNLDDEVNQDDDSNNDMDDPDDEASEDETESTSTLTTNFTTTTSTTTTTTTTTTSQNKNATTSTKRVWFMPHSQSNHSQPQKEYISFLNNNCPTLTCEFGYRTDLYGKPLCSCYNPCHEKRCLGNEICIIEPVVDTKRYNGVCYSPTSFKEGRPLDCLNLPDIGGKCKDYQSRFYYKAQTKTCHHFIYTGCGGNKNRFETWEKCQMECNTCSQPVEKGPCNANLLRYYYDPEKKECKGFSWGGCKGNENNFSSRKHCEDSCIFKKEGALFLNGLPLRIIRKYHSSGNNDTRQE